MSEPDQTDKIVAAIFTAGMLAREDADTTKYLHVYERFLDAMKKQKEEKTEEPEVDALFTNTTAVAPKRKVATTRKRR
jgi:hypothetical protein